MLYFICVGVAFKTKFMGFFIGNEFFIVASEEKREKKTIISIFHY